MAGRRESVQTRRVRKFLLVSLALFFFLSALFIFLTSVNLFSTNRPTAPHLPPRSIPPREELPLAAVAGFFRQQPLVESVFADKSGSQAEILIRLRSGSRSTDFMEVVRRFLHQHGALLVSSRVERGAEYPVRMLLELGNIPLVIRAGWQSLTPPAVSGRSPADMVVPRRHFPRTGKQARVAIVLDDAGGRNPYQWLFLDLRYRLTFAVLPDLEDSRCFAERARRQGFEIILHAPMEPHDLGTMKAPERMITSLLDSGQVIAMLDGFFSTVPGAVGMNNHMGSKATTDPLLMGLVMRELKKRGLYFLDSRTHAASRAHAAARTAGVPALTRDVFLDHERSRAYIRDRLYDLARIAAERGQALGIGHVTHPDMYHVLREMLPKLRKIGIQFVHASELLK